MKSNQTISPENLCRLTGLSRERLRELSRGGTIPRPSKDGYELVPTLKGLFDFYRQRQTGEPVFDSMQQCEAVAGVPVAEQKAAKRGGCPAFETGSRVRLYPLLKFHFEHEREGESLEAAKTREAMARAALLEKKLAEKNKDLIPSGEAEELIRTALLPVRQRLMALASEAAVMCNPTDPQFAHAALTQWVDRALPMIRAHIEKNHE